jgi:hypothetical protein
LGQQARVLNQRPLPDSLRTGRLKALKVNPARDRDLGCKWKDPGGPRIQAEQLWPEVYERAASKGQ